MTKFVKKDTLGYTRIFSITASLFVIIGELVGTFVLIYAGCGSGLVNKRGSGNLMLVGMAVVWGLVVMVMVYTLGHVSGAHFNPAVTIALATSQKFPWKRVPSYIVAQVGGSTLACLVLNALFSKDGMGPTLTLPQKGISPLDAIIWEFIITFFLMFVVCGVATDERAINELSGVAIGATVLFNVLIAGPVTGASMNPARSLGPAIVAKNFQWIWIYIFAPTLGAITASVIYRLLRVLDKSESEASKTV
ncbi:aquaporin NIP1-1-like protein [Cinnamomum micranthum f. kanehirae]|uniref:Aquaporin NIP1-1-like protein n=1 Tax=Cinnamomum micranthum f. kanehirae TaxID=337451 RepID=A0A3S3PK64_9MAGN|nr:aquaporin NIP1-1-like protein [Cinnamomum micranthum f. kanehirae]